MNQNAWWNSEIYVFLDEIKNLELLGSILHTRWMETVKNITVGIS